MILRISSLAVTASLLSSTFAISPSEIPSGTPVSSLLSSAKVHLANGEYNDALAYLDVAISRDPQNYLTIFKRGATYLTLGKDHQAVQDFDKVLIIKPDFEGALLQRAKIRSKHADWKSAREDYEKAGKAGGPEIAELEEAQGAAALAVEAGEQGDWENCVSNSGVAIMTASKSPQLRELRARCRFERGEVLEANSDLGHLLQMQPGNIAPHLRISSETFYSLGDMEKGLAQIRKCLHSDPDSKPCKKLHRREKLLDKEYKKIKTAMEKRKFNNAVKLLLGSDGDVGLIQ